MACSPAIGQTNLSDSIVHQGFQRKYMVHLPPQFTVENQRPLVLSLHGGSGNMVNAQGFSQLNPVADANDFVVAWPQGYGIASPGFSWADGRNTSADQAGIDDVGFIERLIDSLIIQFNIDTSRIFLCGFSNGGFMVQRIACELPDRFAAMASLGASMDTLRFQSCNPTKPIPMAFFNGTSDPAMPFLGGPMQNPQVTPVVPVDSAVQFWVQHNNCQTALPVYEFPDTFPDDNCTAELYTFINCDCQADVWFYKLINGGHTWPGVYIASQASVLGNTNRDISGSDELWEFFSQHSLCNIPLASVTSKPASSVNIHPNPVQSEFQLQVSDQQSFHVVIQNSQGQIVLQKTNSNTIDISDFKQGVYFLNVITSSNRFTKRIIKI